jgi:site-specific DNA-methyltransferase (adenine-specific)
MNKLFFGDNPDVLREHISDETADLIYLNPPFNTKARYNVLFQIPAKDAAEAQAEAFVTLGRGVKKRNGPPPR